MKYLIGIICLVFIITDFAFTINPLIRNIVLAIMTIYALYYIIINKEDNGINSMFDNKKDTKKSIFNMKDLFKK